MASRYNTRLVRVRASYSPSEIARLFSIDKKTCLRWIRYEGLVVIEKNTNPLLVMGAELKKFLLQKQWAKKVELESDQYFCMKCHGARRAKEGTEKIVSTGKKIGREAHEQLKQTGLCEVCSTRLNKFLRVSQKH